jgi:hypothetical protein
VVVVVFGNLGAAAGRVGRRSVRQVFADAPDDAGSPQKCRRCVCDDLAIPHFHSSDDAEPATDSDFL